MKKNKNNFNTVKLHNDEFYYDVLRTNLKTLRKDKGLTQQELADLTLLSREYVCDIENKNRNKHPSLSVIGRIADALEIDIALLFKQ